jgi:beta-galactosidase GanA
MSQKILSHKRTSCFDRFWFGVCYYPEHWSEEDRLKDADLMSEAGVNVVRMAEFAWDIMEPSSPR